MEQYIKNLHHQKKKIILSLEISFKINEGSFITATWNKKKKIKYINAVRNEPLLFLKQFEKHAMNLQSLSEKKKCPVFFLFRFPVLNISTL